MPSLSGVHYQLGWTFDIHTIVWLYTMVYKPNLIRKWILLPPRAETLCSKGQDSKVQQ